MGSSVNSTSKSTLEAFVGSASARVMLNTSGVATAGNVTSISGQSNPPPIDGSFVVNDTVVVVTPAGAVWRSTRS